VRFLKAIIKAFANCCYTIIKNTVYNCELIYKQWRFDGLIGHIVRTILLFFTTAFVNWSYPSYNIGHMTDVVSHVLPTFVNSTPGLNLCSYLFPEVIRLISFPSRQIALEPGKACYKISVVSLWASPWHRWPKQLEWQSTLTVCLLVTVFLPKLSLFILPINSVS